MVVIRLARGGAKKAPFYQVVATDRRNARDGRFIEKLGHFNPVSRGKASCLELNMERVTHWIGLGAQPSDRVAKLLKEYKKAGGTVLAESPTRNEQRNAQAEKSAKAQAAAKAKEAAEKPAEADNADTADSAE